MMLALMALLVACGAKDEKAADDKTTGNNTEPEVEETETQKQLQLSMNLEKQSVKKNPEKVVVFDFGMLDTLDELRC